MSHDVSGQTSKQTAPLLMRPLTCARLATLALGALVASTRLSAPLVAAPTPQTPQATSLHAIADLLPAGDADGEPRARLTVWPPAPYSLNQAAPTSRRLRLELEPASPDQPWRVFTQDDFWPAPDHQARDAWQITFTPHQAAPRRGRLTAMLCAQDRCLITRQLVRWSAP